MVVYHSVKLTIKTIATHFTASARGIRKLFFWSKIKKHPVGELREQLLDTHVFEINKCFSL